MPNLARLFTAPPVAGRRITAGFSFLQRMRRSATTDVWFPQSQHDIVNATIAAGQKLTPGLFPAEWAAVRQFELLHEANNLSVYDLEVTHLRRALTDLSRSMRAGGYRVTIVTLGSYVEADDVDELQILDAHLQERLSQLIHMLYLEEQSQAESETQKQELAKGTWDFRTALPHIGATLGAKDLFRPVHEGSTSAADHRHMLSRLFFNIMGQIPTSHIVHDVAVGLQLPDMIAENEWIYLPLDEHKLSSFNRLLSDIFSPFDTLSLSKLDGRADAQSEVKATMQHMQGYGDRLTHQADRFYSDLATLNFH
ncbi:MAG: hypothetical protein JO126_03620 [Alphaproteobacteria bacterium]|nr:hypothetical protein [Alphaproteobacteria bacterium]